MTVFLSLGPGLFGHSAQASPGSSIASPAKPATEKRRGRRTKGSQNAPNSLHSDGEGYGSRNATVKNGPLTVFFFSLGPGLFGNPARASRRAWIPDPTGPAASVKNRRRRVTKRHHSTSNSPDSEGEGCGFSYATVRNGPLSVFSPPQSLLVVLLMILPVARAQQDIMRPFLSKKSAKQ